jgi:hypothetical protein
MQVNHFDVYAQFLLECKKVMGSVDFERLDKDNEYRTQVCQRIALNVDDSLFEIAHLVNQEIDEEESKNH